MLPGRLTQGRRLLTSLEALAAAPLLRVGLDLGLFRALLSPESAERLAGRRGLDPELVAAWARTLAAAGWLRERAGLFRLAPALRPLVDSPEAPALHALLDYAIESVAPRLAKLGERMKGTERPEPVSAEDAQRIALISRLVERRALVALRRVPGARKAKRVLDVGCGQGAYLAAFLTRYRDAQGVGVERDGGLVEAARRHLQEAGVGRRVEVCAGDFLTLDLPMSGFDLVLLNHNLHYFAPAQYATLLRRARSHLAADGVVAIQTPVLSQGPLARLLGLEGATAVFDLVLRIHEGMYGLPDMEALHRALGETGFDATGEVPVLPAGAVRYVWARSRKAITGSADLP